MPYCKNCGTEVKADDAFCRTCGTARGVDPAADATQQMTTAAPGARAAGSTDASQPGAPLSGSGAATAGSSKTGRAVLVVLLILLLLLLVGGGTWFVARIGLQPIPPAPVAGGVTTQTPAQPATPTAVTPNPPPVSTAPKPPPSGTSGSSGSSGSTSEDGTHPSMITKIKSGGSEMALDYLQLFEGAEAQAEATKRGLTADNDYLIVNDNTKLRSFPVDSGVTIVLHPGEGPGFSRDFSLGEFVSLWESGSSKTYGGKTYTASDTDVYFVKIKNGEITRIEDFWTP